MATCVAYELAGSPPVLLLLSPTLSLVCNYQLKPLATVITAAAVTAAGAAADMLPAPQASFLA